MLSFQSDTPTASNLAEGARTFDFHVYDRNIKQLEVNALKNPIELQLFRTSHKNKINEIPGETFLQIFNAESQIQKYILYIKNLGHFTFLLQLHNLINIQQYYFVINVNFRS